MGGFFDAPRKQSELDKIEKQISEPGFWDDSEAAQKVMGVRSRIEKALAQQKNFETGVSDAEVLFEFAAEDPDSATELQTLINKLESQVSLAETQSLLSGETDANNAICSIQAGAGIVADSVPEKEYEETINKARALVKAIEMAENFDT